MLMPHPHLSPGLVFPHVPGGTGVIIFVFSRLRTGIELSMFKRLALESHCLDLSPDHNGTLGKSPGCTSGSSAQETSQNTGPVSEGC